MDQKDIDALIDGYIKKDERPREIGVYYASEIGYCLRRLYLQYKYPKKLSKEILRIFAVGNIFHEFITKVLSKAGFETHLNERSVSILDSYEDFVLSGRLDEFIVAKKGEKEYVIELKTVNSLGKNGTGPSEMHRIQIAPYIRAMNADGGYILYIEKNTLKTRLYEITDWKECLKIAMARAHKLHKAVKGDILPYKEAVKFNPWMCSYCHYKKECDELGEGKEL